MKKLSVVFAAIASVVSLAQSQTRVYVHGSRGYVYVSGVDHPLPRLDAAGHDQTMELAKTFLQRCPAVQPTMNKESADFDVDLNWTPSTRLFLGGKIIHKPDQILVTNRNGDIIYSGVARSVGGGVEGACRAIQSAEPTTALERHPAANVGVNGTSNGFASRKHASETPNATVAIPALGVTVTTRSEGGAQIVGVTSGSVAELAYLHVGDVIDAVDGKPVNTAMELAALFGSTERGAKVRVGYLYHTAVVGDLQKEAVIVAH